MMTTKHLTGLWVGLFLLATAGSAQAADYCKGFKDANRRGDYMLLRLRDDVGHTYATGAPDKDQWGNTSVRYHSDTLSSAGMQNNISSVHIAAHDSDVALYWFEGDNFDGKAHVMHCKKGRTCYVNLTGRLDNKVSSMICQREFFRKGYADAPITQLGNPIIPASDIRHGIDTTVALKMREMDDIDLYRSDWSEDGKSTSTHSRVAWMTKHQYCKKFNLSCSWRVKYVDYLNISKRFELDLASSALDWLVVADDDYLVELNWYVSPVLAGDDRKMSFWSARRTLWVEKGLAHNDLYNRVLKEVSKTNIQTELREGVVAGAKAAGCPEILGICVDKKKRLQMSFHNPDHVKKNYNVWIESFDMATALPRLVLNDSRKP